MDCVTCELFVQLDGVAKEYARSAYSSLAPWTANLFSAFIGVYYAWVFAWKIYLARGEFDAKSELKQLLIFVFIAALLQAHDFYFAWIYEPAYALMSGLTQIMVSAPATGIDDTGFVSLIERIEEEMLDVISFADSVMSSGGWFDTIGVVLIMGVFMLPFIFVWLIFLAFVLEGAFKLLGVTALGPVLLVAAAFKPSRGLATSGVKLALGGILTVVFAGIAMGFTLTVLDTQVSNLPMDSEGNYTGAASEFIFSKEFFGIFIIGMLSVLFHLKAASMASNLSGAFDGAGAAATVAGVGSGLGTAAIVKSKAAALSGAKRVAGGRRGGGDQGGGAQGGGE